MAGGRPEAIWDSRVATAVISDLDHIVPQDAQIADLFPGLGTVPGVAAHGRACCRSSGCPDTARGTRTGNDDEIPSADEFLLGLADIIDIILDVLDKPRKAFWHWPTPAIPCFIKALRW